MQRFAREKALHFEWRTKRAAREHALPLAHAIYDIPQKEVLARRLTQRFMTLNLY